MRPINLIPPEERRQHGETRTGALAYILVAGLAVILIGIVVLVLTSNQIGDKEKEVTSLEAQKTAAMAKADQLAPYTRFHELTDQRVRTVSQLADSRFDWPRVIDQMARILPPAIYFTSMTGSAGGGAGEGTEIEVAGPSLVLEGCGPSQGLVAAFVASLKDIDGVTRVGLKKSEIGEGGGGGTSFCEGSGLFQFEMIVAFDSAPPSPDGAGAVEEAAPEAEGGEAAEGESSESKSAGGEENSEASSSEETASSETGVGATG